MQYGATAPGHQLAGPGRAKRQRVLDALRQPSMGGWMAWLLALPMKVCGIKRLAVGLAKLRGAGFRLGR